MELTSVTPNPNDPSTSQQPHINPQHPTQQQQQSMQLGAAQSSSSPSPPVKEKKKGTLASFFGLGKSKDKEKEGKGVQEENRGGNAVEDGPASNGASNGAPVVSGQSNADNADNTGAAAAAAGPAGSSKGRTADEGFAGVFGGNADAAPPPQPNAGGGGPLPGIGLPTGTHFSCVCFFVSIYFVICAPCLARATRLF